MTTTSESQENPTLQVTNRAEEILNETGVLTNDYLKALADGSMTKEVFRLSQEQFFFAVTFFPRPMTALVGRLPDPMQRLDILKNVVEEHGEFAESKFHQTTFVQFLTSLGSDIKTLGDEKSIWPEVRVFNTVLAGSCLLAELELGIACMGIIELAFASISASIGSSVVRRQWVDRDNLRHYTVHAELDERHADEFFQVIEPSWDDPNRHHYIEQGLNLGAFVFKQLYECLYTTAQSKCVIVGQQSDKDPNESDLFT
ncbi:MAG: iron-containing redox enzyme family protein [Gammaproteobacteria bacterium]|nr:iron-containing redox enzyme family protein [Gammaproteobacteria bacterium]MYF37732.1 iron-containing redox enzyme family protein [Gammaproteobacteria bacterium]